VDLGEQEIYTLVSGRFSVANRGGTELLLNQFRVSCANCTGIGRELDGRPVRVQEVRVPPGQSIELTVQQAVHGPVGGSNQAAINFKTNDPNVPEGRLLVRVRRVGGGVEMCPRSVVCGSMRAGDSVRHVIHVTDESPSPRQIERIVSSDPEGVKVRQLAAEPTPASGSRGKHIARLEVTICSLAAGPIEERLEIYLTGRSLPCVLPVSGLVRALVDVTPRTLLLPQMSDRGPIYEAKCLCRTTEDKPVKLRVETCPPDITVRIGCEENRGHVQTIHVQWDPERSGPDPQPVRMVRLRASIGDAEVPLEITVACRPRGAL
jgi:hypothetical protein